MIEIHEPICIHCKWQFGWDWPKCTAFPLGIPEGVLKGNLDHHKPIEGDHGYQFEESEL